MLPLALIGTVLTVVKEKETGESVTARALIGAVVSDVAGDDDAETGKLRTFLRKVLLEDVPVDQALTQVGLPDLGTWPSKRDRIRFFNRAKGLFQGRVDGVLAELIRYRQRLTDPE